MAEHVEALAAVVLAVGVEVAERRAAVRLMVRSPSVAG